MADPREEARVAFWASVGKARPPLPNISLRHSPPAPRPAVLIFSSLVWIMFDSRGLFKPEPQSGSWARPHFARLPSELRRGPGAPVIFWAEGIGGVPGRSEGRPPAAPPPPGTWPAGCPLLGRPPRWLHLFLHLSTDAPTSAPHHSTPASLAFLFELLFRQTPSEPSCLCSSS